MYRLTSILSVLALVFVAACGSDSKPAGDTGGVNPDGGGVTPDTGTTTPDQGTQPAPTTSLLQSVLNSMTLPTKPGQYQLDLDGTGPKNAFGGLLAAMSGFGMDMQPSLDAQFTDGSLLMLIDLLGKDLTNDTNVVANAYLGVDADEPPDATNNYTGGELAIDPASPKDMSLAGAITGGKLGAGPGTLALPIPIGDSALMVTIAAARIEATVSADGLTEGVMGGAIPESDLDGKILPAVVELVNNLSEDSKKTVLGLLDTNKDGAVDVPEIKGSIIGAALASDVDTDNDGKPDAVSLGVGFTAAKTVIKK